MTVDRGRTHQNKLANKMMSAIFSVCESARPEQRRKWVDDIPAIPLEFAQLFVHALVRVDVGSVRAALSDLAARDDIPGPLIESIRGQLKAYSRFSSPVTIDSLLSAPDA
jgi:hypothetical protein